MFKIFCLLLIYVTVGYAVDMDAEIKWGHIYRGKKYSGVTISNPGRSETNITWNKPVTAELNALSATYQFTLYNMNDPQHGKIENLCEPLKKGSVEEMKRLYILKMIANTESCPIKKGTTVTYSTPFNYTYIVDEGLGCGEFIGHFQVYKKGDKDCRRQKILSSTYEGMLIAC